MCVSAAAVVLRHRALQPGFLSLPHPSFLSLCHLYPSHHHHHHHHIFNPAPSPSCCSAFFPPIHLSHSVKIYFSSSLYASPPPGMETYRFITALQRKINPTNSFSSLNLKLKPLTLAIILGTSGPGPHYMISSIAVIPSTSGSSLSTGSQRGWEPL